tara:strand:- start:401 stop:1336 length:936 start_codon:yes stop_codon:yes gene_type:complete
MSQKIILRLSNEMGNQMFMYAAGYAFGKKLNRELLLDNETAFMEKKNISKYRLNDFEITGKIAPNDLKFLSSIGYIKKKILKKIDKFKRYKNFYIEKKDENKVTFFDDSFLNEKYANNLFIEGHFESEKYFKEFKNEIRNEFIFKNIDSYKNNLYYNMIKNSNSVSICIRQNRFSEKNRKINDDDIQNSKSFTNEQIVYIKKCIDIIKSKIDKPKFFVWSNDYTNLEHAFPEDNFTLVKNKENISNDKRVSLDLFLMSQAKNHIVVPSSFNWWGCWLSNNSKSIVIRPSPNNFKYFKVNNNDLWPESWLKI